MNYEWKKHPFRLLLYLEWILLGIAFLAVFSLFLDPHPHHLHQPTTIFPIATIISIILLGVMGWRLPIGSRLIQGLYISLGFGLSWLAVLLGGRGERIFPALLLIVVIRACLLFPWSGRIIVSIFSYLSFIFLQVMGWLKISPLGISLGRHLPRELRHLPSEELQNLLFSLIVNSALLFGLVLAFILLLVGAVLSEHQSREQLTIANLRLHQYALTVENQATLQERNRIAREIHDSVGHYLTAQSIQLENTALFLFQEPQKAANHLQKARKLGKEALQNVRSAVATLRNDPLKKRSFSISIQQLITEFKRNTNIKVKSEINLSAELNSEVSLVLYRIIQEALTNIYKHSQATLVHLEIIEQEQNIQLKIDDNGNGFNPTENTTGFGLQSMRERTEALNGHFYLISKPGQGCQIKVKIPLWRIR